MKKSTPKQPERVAEIDIELEIPAREYPLNYRSALHGYAIKLCNDDNQHGQSTNNYHYSSIEGMRHVKGAIAPHTHYRQHFTIRTAEPKILCNILSRINDNREVFGGIRVKKHHLKPVNYQKCIFSTRCMSPILLSDNFDKVRGQLNNDQVTIAERYLENSVKRRMQQYGLECDPELRIVILKQHDHQTVVKYKDRTIQGRNLILRITANDETKKFILTHGLGRSTGIGFGFIE